MIKLTHPYTDLAGGAWLRGNLHTHTKQSDGAAAPQDVIDHYASLGHDFLMFSDHEVYTSEAVYRQWDSRGLILIPGNEIAGGSHLLHVDADRKVDPRPSRQEIINEINAATRETGRGFVIVNHPNWENKFDHATIAQMREWTGYLGLEIYNGIITVLDGSPYATNKWDLLLADGRRLWGFANDDSHHPRLVGLGWNVVYAKERTVAGVVEALRAGRFYPSTGVVISKIEVEGTTIRLETENARRICALRDVGRRFAIADDRVIEVEAPAGATYVRFECWGDGESFAWTQPFFLEEVSAAGDDKPLFMVDWQASKLLEHGTLEGASPAEAAEQRWQPNPAHQRGHSAAGFVDVQSRTGGQAGIVYLQTAFQHAGGRGLLKLGYDGPVRVWLNGRELFCGPGTNPALPDQLSLYADFVQGENTLLIALDSNRGKAWGIYARVTE